MGWAGCAICWVLASATAGFSAETPLQLAIQMQGKTAGVTITGEPGTPLEMEYLDEFSATNNWRFLAYIELPQASFLWMDPASPAASQRFYRAVKVPTNMVLIPEGRFQIGDTFAESYADERPAHSVFISTFYIDRHETTKARWDFIYNWATNNGYAFDNPGSGKAPEHPVHSLSWFDAVKWCNARAEHDGLAPVYFADAALTEIYRTNSTVPYPKWPANGYRLPTEAEWEKAARGAVGNQRFSWAGTNVITHILANYLSDAAYAYDTSPTRGYHPLFGSGGTPYTSPVGFFSPNGYGLHDMTGNVMEWCWDWYDGSYYGTPAASQDDPRGAAGPANYRVLRGGSCMNYAIANRVAYRTQGLPGNESMLAGFRCVRGPY
jgi:formylglycine-generating enzyme required for sulfatase activity